MIISLLLAAGFLLPILHMLNLEALMPSVFLASTASVMLLSLPEWLKKPNWLGVLLIPAGLYAALTVISGGNGALSLIKDSVIALYLMYAGYDAALPLYALPAVILLSAFITAVTYLLASNAGFSPAMTFSGFILFILWSTGKGALFIYFIPSLIALVILYAADKHENLSTRRILPVAAILVALAYLLVPPGGVVSSELQKAAQDIRQAISDHFFFTEPRSIFSLASEGFYPNGVTQLGGTAEPSERLVMEVKAEVPVYLRGAIKDEYSGRSWTDTTGGKRLLYVSPINLSARNMIFNANLPEGELARSSMMNEITVTVKLLTQSPTTLYVPQRVRSLQMLTDGMVPYFNNASEIFVTRDLMPGDTYSVSAAIVKAGDPGLGTFLAACRERGDTGGSYLDNRYTALPEHLDEQIVDLARRATDDCLTDYDKAMALQNYLARHFKYTLSPEPAQDNVDFVTYFLLRGKEGYCVYFASAMTVLCRTLGLPARYIEGFLVEPDASGVAYVTGKDAHAWTEVYFKGFGWLTFDATPAHTSNTQRDADQPQNENNDQNEEDDSGDAPEMPPDTTQEPGGEEDDNLESDTNPEHQQPEQEEEEQPNLVPDLSHLWPMLFYILLTLLLLLFMWRFVYAFPQMAAKHTKRLRDQYDIWMQAVYDAVYLSGHGKLPGETLTAHAARLDLLKVFPVPLLPVADILSHMSYSRHPIESSYINSARKACLSVMRGMTAPQRLRFVLYRTFVPRRKSHYLKKLSGQLGK
ncbi:MAG: DUF3488 and transglutaminase-like domain-containing protein [Clostridia bacterium]|nr:DUF3488 and transglutaminase-like domain-containing protein [Clostridia bacterium]